MAYYSLHPTNPYATREEDEMEYLLGTDKLVEAAIKAEGAVEVVDARVYTDKAISQMATRYSLRLIHREGEDYNIGITVANDILTSGKFSLSEDVLFHLIMKLLKDYHIVKRK